jgi:hypothetical protein
MVRAVRSGESSGLPQLIGLAVHEGEFYGFHDPQKQPVEVEPMDRPLIIHEVPTAMPFALFVRSLRLIAPDALALGYPVFQYGTADFIDAAIQFHRIAESECDRLLALPESSASVKQYLISHR